MASGFHERLVQMRRYLPVLLAVAACLIAFGLLPTFLAQKKYQSWEVTGFTKYVTIPGATRVGSEACAACHTDLKNNFRHAFHAGQGVECEDCHGAGSAHIDGGGDVTKIVSYGRRSARDANGACLSCHVQDESVRNWMAGPHMSNGLRCTDCHQVHGQYKGRKNDVPPNFERCLRARKPWKTRCPKAKRWSHAGRKMTLACNATRRSAGKSVCPTTFLREGKMDCADCHDPHGGPGGNNLRTANANQLCLGCHAQYRGPFAYQHPPVNENCMACQHPHGSANTKSSCK